MAGQIRKPLQFTRRGRPVRPFALGGNRADARPSIALHSDRNAIADPSISALAWDGFKSDQLERRSGTRARNLRIRAWRQWRSDRDGEPVWGDSPRSDRYIGDPVPTAHRVPVSVFCDSRRLNLLRA